MRILAITQRLEEACTRYRISQYQPRLEERGVQLDVISWPESKRGQRDLVRRLPDWQAVVVQRRLPSLRMIRELRKGARRLIFDFDDAIIYKDSASGEPRLLLDKWLRFRALVRCCDSITAGNRYLAGIASKFSPPDRVFILPTVVDLKSYENRSPTTRSSNILGWIGSRSTVPYLENLRRPLELVHSQLPDLQVKVISDQKPDLGSMPVQWLQWNARTEVQELPQIRVGLAPLPDDRWTRGKCALRLLQYLAAEVAAVASPVGTQAEITSAGAALKARTQTDWVSAILALLHDQNLRIACVARGAELVNKVFSVTSCVSQLERIWCG